MPDKKGNRIGVMVYLLPETYRALENARSPYVTASANCAMLLEKAIADKA